MRAAATVLCWWAAAVYFRASHDVTMNADTGLRHRYVMMRIYQLLAVAFWSAAAVLVLR